LLGFATGLWAYRVPVDLKTEMRDRPFSPDIFKEFLRFFPRFLIVLASVGDLFPLFFLGAAVFLF